MKTATQFLVGMRWIFLPLAVYVFGAIFSGRSTPRWVTSVTIAIVALVSATVLLSLLTKSSVPVAHVAPHGERLVARTI